MKNVCLNSFLNEGLLECGCDEAGRGPLAGPVFASAVILPGDFHHPLLNDSKQMSARAREQLRQIIEAEAVAWHVEAVDAGEIDAINILNASIVGMQRSVLKLMPRPEFILVDGNRFRPFTYIAALCAKAGPGTESAALPPIDILEAYDRIPYKCIVKGDSQFASIAAASVLAKTHRDEFMRKIAAEYPEYGWDKNMGYPTPDHIEAVRRHGLSPYHRRSFHLKALEPTLF